VLGQAQEPKEYPKDKPSTAKLNGVKMYFVWFRQGLKELGYVGGHNIIIEYRIAEPISGDYGQYAKLATNW
jgi:hypothetical protein